jgi:cytochrome oxidase Cu insertion factor (SCO1/SenC/PrrC family)
MSMQKLRSVFAAGMVLVFVLGVSLNLETVAEDDVFAAMKVTRVVPPVMAPDLEIPTATGSSLRLSDLRGKAVIVGFFVTT